MKRCLLVDSQKHLLPEPLHKLKARKPALHYIFV